MTSMAADPIRDAARGAAPARPRARRPRPGARTGAAGAPWGRIRAPSATMPRGPPNEPRLASRARLSRVCRPCRDCRLNNGLAEARTRKQGIAQVLPVTSNRFQSRWQCPRPASRRRRVTPEAAQPTPIPDAPLRARNGHVLGRRSPLPVRHGAGPSQRSQLEPRQRDYGRPAPVRRRPASARSVLSPMHRGTPYDPMFPLVWAPVMRTACNGLLPTRRAGSIALSRTRDGPFFLSRASARRRTAEAAVFGRH